jgi:RNA polymerase sigma factor for flagellar operon FliA
MDNLIGTNVAVATDNSETNEMRHYLAHTIEQMPEKIKLILSLYYVDKLTMKEIGKILNMTESRVSHIHSQAKILVRTLLQEEISKNAE